MIISPSLSLLTLPPYMPAPTVSAYGLKPSLSVLPVQIYTRVRNDVRDDGRTNMHTRGRRVFI